MLEVAQKLPSPLRKLVCAYLRMRYDSELLLSREHFAGRQVLILGPARTVDDDLSGLDPSSYDLIIRMNNGLDTPIAALGEDALRCDVLFHSLTSDTRPVSRQKLACGGVSMIVHRAPAKSSIIQTLAARRRFGPDVSVRCLSQQRHRGLTEQLGGKSPTTGLLVADFLSECDLAGLAVVGFTFFDTAYCAGYDDSVSGDEAARQRVVAAAHHAPLQEILLFADRMRRLHARGSKVILGRGVRAALEREGALL